MTRKIGNAPEIIPVISRLRAAADRFPDRRAFVGAVEITYGDLYRRVRRWAAFFSHNGLGAGDRVAIWLPKCLEYAVTLYAAMEAGGVYVPMDGAQPAARASKILDSAGPSVLVTDRAHLEQLGGYAPQGLRLVVLVDRSTEPVSWSGPGTLACIPELDGFQERGTARPAEPDGGGLAAILFTSGSTGVPKGVRISHGNLHTFIAWATAELTLSETDVFANHAGFHFDLSTFDLFAAAVVGGAVWVVTEAEQREPAALLEGLRRHRVSVWYSVPSILTLLANSGELDARATAALRYVLFAGEVFPIRHLRTLHGLLPVSCALYNLYGPTETNVCLFHRVRERDLARDRPVYIGTPIPGQTAEVVDGDGNPVDATTELGELVISGSCVTPGYWGTGDGRNDANHRRGRHATGDLVRREDGLFVYHGRKDRMIKLNGNRVELGEIEAALLSVPAIVEVAVVVDTCESAQNIVAFYATGDGAAKLGLLEIKKHCSGLLPRYMIPRFAHHLDELPKNRNGKIDFGALAQRLARKEPLRAEREGAAPDSVAGPAW